MKKTPTQYLIGLAMLLIPAAIFAQAFGEYGRTLGGIPHGQGITGSRPPGGVTQGGTGSGGVGDVGGRTLPTRLVVATKDAGLYPRQDEESEKLFQLAQGETLMPMIQSAGGSEWYMVKTQKGVVGWVKSTDVREERTKNNK
jgi:hypothetical protein